MDYSQHWIFEFLAPYAFQPTLIYGIIVAMMIASGFGLPIPEEITIISVAILAHMGAHPEKFPPPFIGAAVVNKYTASVICVSAVLFSDLVVYKIGQKFGGYLMTKPSMKRFFANDKMLKVQKWTHDYGIWAVFFFRFMPGIRFPGHIFCGLMNLKLWKFLAMDSFAALISIPTQLIFVATYGEEILSTIFHFKVYVFGALGIVLLGVLLKRLIVWSSARTKSA